MLEGSRKAIRRTPRCGSLRELEVGTGFKDSGHASGESFLQERSRKVVLPPYEVRILRSGGVCGSGAFWGKRGAGRCRRASPHCSTLRCYRGSHSWRNSDRWGGQGRGACDAPMSRVRMCPRGRNDLCLRSLVPQCVSVAWLDHRCGLCLRRRIDDQQRLRMCISSRENLLILTNKYERRDDEQLAEIRLIMFTSSIFVVDEVFDAMTSLARDVRVVFAKLD